MKEIRQTSNRGKRKRIRTSQTPNNDLFLFETRLKRKLREFKQTKHHRGIRLS